MRFFNMLLMVGCTWIAGSMQGATTTNRAVMVNGANGTLVAPTAAAFAGTNGMATTNELALGTNAVLGAMTNHVTGVTNRLVNTNALRLATNGVNANATNLVRSATNGVARASQLIAATNGVAYRWDLKGSNSFEVWTPTITTNLSAELISNGDFSAGGDGWSSATWTFGSGVASWSSSELAATATMEQYVSGAATDGDYVLVWYGSWTTNSLVPTLGSSGGGLSALSSAGEYVTNEFIAITADGLLSFTAEAVEPLPASFTVDNVSLKRYEYTTNWSLMFSVNGTNVTYGTNVVATWEQVRVATNQLSSALLTAMGNIQGGSEVLYFYGSSNVNPFIPAITPTNVQHWMFTAPSTNGPVTNSVNGVTNGQYLLARVSATKYKRISSGPVSWELFPFLASTAGGKGMDVVGEVYAFDTVNSNVWELGVSAAGAVGAAASPLAKQVLTINLADWVFTNEVYLVGKLRSTNVTGVPDFRLVTEGDYDPHLMLNVPNVELGERIVREAGLAATNFTQQTSSNLAITVNAAINNASNRINGEFWMMPGRMPIATGYTLDYGRFYMATLRSSLAGANEAFFDIFPNNVTSSNFTCDFYFWFTNRTAATNQFVITTAKPFPVAGIVGVTNYQKVVSLMYTNEVGTNLMVYSITNNLPTNDLVHLEFRLQENPRYSTNTYWFLGARVRFY